MQNLLGHFESESSVPPTFVATEQVIAEFHKDLLSTQKSIKWMILRYNDLKRLSTLRTLPLVTAKAFLERLLYRRHFQTVTRLLLEYNLDEAVSIAGHELRKLSQVDREFCLFGLYEGLQTQGQMGLANQILAELGYGNTVRRTAIDELSTIHSRISSFDIQQLTRAVSVCKALAQRMRTNKKDEMPDAYSVYTLVRRGLVLKEFAFCRALCLQSWYAEDATRLFLADQSDQVAFDVFVDQYTAAKSQKDFPPNLSRTGRSVIWMQKTPERLKILTALVKDVPELQYALACQLAKTRGTGALCFSNANHLDSQQIARVVYEYVREAPEDSAVLLDTLKRDLRAFLETLENIKITGVLEHFSQIVKQAHSAKREQYPASSLFLVLDALDTIKYEAPLHIEALLRQHIMYRPTEVLLRFALLKQTRIKSLTKIVNHCLRLLRIAQQPTEHEVPLNGSGVAESSGPAIKDEPNPADVVHCLQSDSSLMNASIFSRLIILLYHRSGQTQETLDDLSVLYETILLSLVQLPDAKLLLSFLSSTEAAGVKLTPDHAKSAIRILALRDQQVAIEQILKAYPLSVITYDTHARHISRISQTAPATAMSLLKLMLSKGAAPRPRLLQNVMSGISESTTITHGRAFKYLTELFMLRASLGYPNDRVQIAALMRVVLMRQGLGAATRRIEWLLRHSMRLTASKTDRKSRIAEAGHKELVDILRKWHIYERSRGLEVRQLDGGQKRPKQLREFLIKLGSRKTVIGRKMRKRSIAKSKA